MAARKQATRVPSRSGSSPVPSMDLLFKEAVRTLEAKTAPVDYRPNDGVGWILDNFRIPRDESPDNRLHLPEYQIDTLREALRKDADGNFVYSTVLWSDIKKSGKSVIAAAVVLFRAWHTEFGQFYIIANKRDQADSRVGYYLRRAIQLHPELKEVCVIRASGYTITFPNHSIIQAIPVDPSGEAGSNADMTEWTELHGATGDAAEKMWAEMTIPATRYGRSQKWVDTYAGYEGESNLLWRLYESGVLQGERIRADFPLYVNRTSKMLTLWNDTPRCPWQLNNNYYAEEALSLTPSEFARLHQNRWASASESFCPMEWWDACKGDIPPYEDEVCVGAIDGAISNDSFGLCVGSKLGDKTVIRYSRRWLPPRNGNIDFEEIEAEIVRLSSVFNIAEWCYDPTHVKDMCMRMMKRGVAYFYEFNQGQLRLIADKAWYDKIMQRNVLHDGNAELREHVSNSNAQSVTVEGRQFLRIVKRSQAQKIDLNVTASMLSHELQIALNIS